jgi:hypothetical protein
MPVVGHGRGSWPKERLPPRASEPYTDERPEQACAGKRPPSPKFDPALRPKANPFARLSVPALRDEEADLELVWWCLRSRASWREKDAGEACRATAEFVED